MAKPKGAHPLIARVVAEKFPSKTWYGDLSNGCDICKHPFGKYMYDARTISGQWGNLDDSCFVMHGVGLGTGQGQKYERQTDDSFVKVEG